MTFAVVYMSFLCIISFNIHHTSEAIREQMSFTVADANFISKIRMNKSLIAFGYNLVIF